MRMPKPNERLIGKVCVCSVGRPAIVVGRQQMKFKKDSVYACTPSFTEVWIGLGLDGKGTWASTEPCIIAESGEEFHNKLFQRFGGKMPFNG